MLSRLTILLLFLSLLQGAYAQSNGYVRDARTSRGLEGVHISLLRDSVGLGATDSLGRFDVRLLASCGERDTLLFSYVGYTPLKCTRGMLQVSDYQVSLFEENRYLNEVDVVGDRFYPWLRCEFVGRLPTPLFSFGSCLHEGKIYVLAGDETSVYFQRCPVMTTVYDRYRSSAIYVYDLKQNVCETRKPKLTARANHVAQLYNDRIFLLGGVRYSTNKRLDYTDEKLEVYDLKKDTVYAQASNLHLAKNAASFVYEDLLFVVGGSEKELVYSDKIHALDLKRGYWYEVGEIPKPLRREMNGVLVGDKAYFFGGRRGLTICRDINSYDLRTGEWRCLGNLAEAVSYPGLAVQGDLVFIQEGRNLQVYDCRSNNTRLYPLDREMESAAIHLDGNNLYIVGGCVRNGPYISPTAVVWRVDVGRLR